MRISPNWLREYVDLKVGPRQLAEDLTLAGIAVENIQNVNGQPIFEMDITTNRVDAMNHYGVSRECSAIYDLALKPIQPRLPKEDGSKHFPIEILDPQLCARYTARVVCDIRIGKSPAHIAERLLIEEHHGINNVADATNYVLMEMGHPTHAFDLDLLAGGKIIVRRARPGETLKTLDGVERKLHPEDLVIADARRPVALAGVMGGWDTMITEKTRNVLIESAWFEPASVRRTARRHGMHTDASHRFERGADWGATPLACNRVAELILQSAGGKLQGGLVDAVARELRRPVIQLSRSEILRILGKAIPDADVLRILRRLGFVVTSGAAPANVSSVIAEAATLTAISEEPAAYTVEVPTWRMDVERDIDLIEEMARIYGFNRFENTLPAFVGSVVELPDAKKETVLREGLLAQGYTEALSSSFISRADAGRFSSRPAVGLANPLSDEAPLLRNSLVPGMLEMLAWNLNRGTTDVQLFENGHIFFAQGDQVEEKKALCLGATGNAHPGSIQTPARAFSFYDLKGAVEELLSKFESSSLQFEANAGEYYHPGRSASVVMNGTVVGRVGEIHPSVAAERKLRQEIYIAELYLDRLLQFALREPRYRKVSRFPAVERDFSFIIDNSVTFARLQDALLRLNIAELRSVSPKEIFRGGSVAAGKYSLLLRTVFQSSERTLRDDEVTLWSDQIIKAIEALGGSLRS